MIINDDFLAIGKFENSNVFDFLTNKYKKIKIIDTIDSSINIQRYNFFLFENNSNAFKNIKVLKKLRSNTFIALCSHTYDKDDLIQALELNINSFLEETLPTNILEEKINTSFETFYKKSNDLHSQYFDITNKSTMVLKIDRKGRVIYVNDKFLEVSAYKKDEIYNKDHSLIFSKKDNKRILKNLLKTIVLGKTSWEGVIKNRIKHGSSYYMKTTIMPIFNSDNSIKEFILFGINISEIMSDKNQLIDDIEASKLSILSLVQIDEYSILERFYNYEVIDKIEKKFADSLLLKLNCKKIFKKVYFLGHGRYAFLGNFDTYMKTQGNLKNFFDSFVNNINNSILLCDDIEYDLNVTLSFSYGKHMLYEDARQGLEEGIKSNSFTFDSNDESLKGQKFAKKNMDIIKMVKVALENYNITTYFQPIINNVTEEIEKYESLVRLIDEDYNVVSPYHFLQVTKESNYYNKITHRVLTNSFKIIDKINTDVSINLSMLDIEKEETRKLIFSLLEEHKEYTNKIVFELLEDESVRNFAVIKKFIKEVKEHGVKIAIDDFGSGYSSFERVLEFEPDIIKIDGSIIKNIVHDKPSRHIVETIADFAKKQDIKTIAEYVETKEIFDVLKEIGIDFSQGYYFGKPEAMNFK